MTKINKLAEAVKNGITMNDAIKLMGTKDRVYANIHILRKKGFPIINNNGCYKIGTSLKNTVVQSIHKDKTLFKILNMLSPRDKDIICHIAERMLYCDKAGGTLHEVHEEVQIMREELN